RTLTALRRHIASLEGAPAASGCARGMTGHAAIDAALGGGLVRGRVHELFGAGEDEGAAVGLALAFAHLLAGEAPLFWLRTMAGARAGGAPYGPGLAALGLDPDR